MCGNAIHLLISFAWLVVITTSSLNSDILGRKEDATGKAFAEKYILLSNPEPRTVSHRTGDKLSPPNLAALGLSRDSMGILGADWKLVPTYIPHTLLRVLKYAESRDRIARLGFRPRKQA